MSKEPSTRGLDLMAARRVQEQLDAYRKARGLEFLTVEEANPRDIKVAALFEREQAAWKAWLKARKELEQAEAML
jgi:hypothetical protein